MSRSSPLLPYTLFSLLWSLTNLTIVFQPMGEVSHFKLRFTHASLAFFCNLNYAVCPKEERCDTQQRERFYQSTCIIISICWISWMLSEINKGVIIIINESIKSWLLFLPSQRHPFVACRSYTDNYLGASLLFLLTVSHMMGQLGFCG